MQRITALFAPAAACTVLAADEPPRAKYRPIGAAVGPDGSLHVADSQAGRVWRIARQFDSRVVRQVSEADVGNSVVLVFKAVGKGNTTVAFGLTHGETAKAYESRRFVVTVR